MPTKSVAVPDAVSERVQQIAAAEGTTESSRDEGDRA
jgi:hypothetical protein